MRPCVWFTGLSLLAACNRGGSGPDDAPQDACHADAPVRLAALPEGWVPDDWAVASAMARVGDHIVFQFGPTYYQIDVCGGPALRLDMPPARGLQVFAVPTGAGPRLYGADSGGGKLYRIDRLDVRGADPPVEIGSFPGGFMWPALLGDRVLFTGSERWDRPISRVAGLGLPNYIFLLHGGDGRDAVPLRDDVVASWSDPGDATRRLALVESGELLQLDVAADEATTLIAGVRAAFPSPDRTRAV